MQFHTLASVVAWLGVALAAWLPAAVGALPPQPSSTCLRKCGNVDIPYPFGIGAPESPDHCAMPGFNLTCDNDAGSGFPRPFYLDLEVADVSLQQGQARMLNPISSSCYNTSTRVMDYNNWSLNLTDTAYRFSDTNKFTAIGCRTLAYIADEYYVGKLLSGCVAVCRRGNTTAITNGSCSGIGCCQTDIPKKMQYYQVLFDPRFNTSEIYNVSPCSYAVLMDPSNFTFLLSYVTSPEFNNTYGGRAPLLMDWAIRNEATCEAARMKRESYACASANSECFNSLNGPGYICNCTQGFRGNPYLLNGCQDIDECTDDPNNYPCRGRLCQNKAGGFQCYCPPGTRGDASLGPCEKELTKRQRMAIGVVGFVLGCLFLFLGIEWIRLKRRTKIQDLMRKKDQYFQQHGGQILSDLMTNSSSEFTHYNPERIELATNNFDKGAIIGEGGQGTVYEGHNLDLKANPVAIKRCKGFDADRRKEFVQELLILSHVEHDNIVKLLGCCLKLEVPVLVYEFVPNGTLHNLMHVQGDASLRTLGIRLKIASESAAAIAHLHSQDRPILHGDVKSANILIGDKFVAKVSDFGCSTIWSADENPNVVKGTIGYLDPEYLLSYELTDKSDVYSFGVILLELLTRRKPLSRKKEISLASVFQEAVKRGNVEELVDEEIVHEDDMELVRQVADLARRCLVVAGESRPAMSRVAEELRRLAGQVHQRRGALHHGAGQLTVYGRTTAGATSEYPSGEEETTDYYSLKKKASMGIAFAR